MSRFITSNPLYDNAGVVRPNGDIFCSGLTPKGKVNVSEREWFKLVSRTRSPQIGGLQFGKISGKPGIIAAMPGSELVILDRLKHAIFIEATDRVLPDVRRFLLAQGTGG